MGKKQESCVDDSEHQGEVIKVCWFDVYKAGGRGTAQHGMFPII